MSARTMNVAGIMSGTSADGIDIAVMRIESGSRPFSKSENAAKVGRPSQPKLKLLAHEPYPFAPTLRRAILAAMNATATSTAELAHLHWRMGIAYAEAVAAIMKRHKLRVDLIGCHGQTLYHQPRPGRYADRSFACTWQVGEAQVIASRLAIPVVSNFRPADILAGGQGAPLVSLLDYVLFADRKRGRVLQNLGGIANLTAIPAGALPHAVLAFDTGPGNMVVDWLAQNLFSKRFDRNGALAARGTVLKSALDAALRHPYFRQKPPRTAGREQFGREYAAEFLASCRRLSKKPEDAMATATALTAETIACSYGRFVLAAMNDHPVDYIVSGGGALNSTLMEMLEARLAPLGCALAASDDFGLPVEAKEAAAFALLAWQTWHRLPGNVPAATGAKRPVILGQITYV